MRRHQSENLALMGMPIGQSQNDGSSDSQEIPVSMDNVRPGGTEDQSITYPSREALGRNVQVRRSECIRKSPHFFLVYENHVLFFYFYSLYLDFEYIPFQAFYKV